MGPDELVFFYDETNFSSDRHYHVLIAYCDNQVIDGEQLALGEINNWQNFKDELFSFSAKLNKSQVKILPIKKIYELLGGALSLNQIREIVINAESKALNESLLSKQSNTNKKFWNKILPF